MWVYLHSISWISLVTQTFFYGKIVKIALFWKMLKQIRKKVKIKNRNKNVPFKEYLLKI